MRGRSGIRGKLAGAAAMVALAEALVDGSTLGSVVGGFALAWLAALLIARPAVRRDRAAGVAALAAAGFGIVLVDDPSVLAWAMFWVALSLAALLPRRGFDTAAAWGARLGWHAASGVVAPVRDAAAAARVGVRRVGARSGAVGVLALLVLPVVGGAVFLALFASANPLIGNALARIVPSDAVEAIWRTLLAGATIAVVWPALRPARSTTASLKLALPWRTDVLDPPLATLTLSLVVFNAIFAGQNALDLAFLWSGAALPQGVTMAEYAHQGAYPLIVTALLAGGFVLVALRPGSVGATSPLVRRLVTLWIAQNVLLVASSTLRTLDYVETYGMTELRLAALAWMGLVATGLVLIGWRLIAGRSAGWLVNANAAAATLVLAVASVVDLGAATAAWNARVALARGRAGPPLDLCYMARLGPSALVPLATLERHARDPRLRDRLAYLRTDAQDGIVAEQRAWRSWTWRGERRLAEARTIVGAVRLREAGNGRACDGRILPPPRPAPTPTPLTRAPQR